MSTSWKLLVALVLIVLGGLAAAPGQESSDTELEVKINDVAGFGPALDRLADRLANYIREKGVDGDTILVDDFSSPKNGSGGRLIQAALAQRLDSRNLRRVSSGADNPSFVVAGKVSFSGDVQMTANLRVTLSDSQNNELREFSDSFYDEVREQATGKPARPFVEPEKNDDGKTRPEVQAVIRDQVDVAQLSQRTLDFIHFIEAALNLRNTSSPAATEVTVTNEQKKIAVAAKQAAVKASFERSNAPHFVSKTPGAVSASATSLFEVRVRSTVDNSNKNPPNQNYQPVSIVDNGGEAFADMNEGQYYCVDIINRSSHAVGVELMVDGINTLELCEVPEWKKAGKFVIESGKQITIPGWLISPTQFALFELAPEPQGLAVELGRVQEIGVVTTTFYAAWNQDEHTPIFEQLLAGPAASKEPATIVGPAKNLGEGETVRDAEKVFGSQPLSIVSVRYRNQVPVDLPSGSPEKN